MEHRYTPSPDIHLCRDASPSNTRSQCNCDRQSSSSSSSSRVCDRAAISEEWAQRPRRHDMDKHTKRQRWSTYTADTSSTALESGNEDITFTRHSRKISCDDSATLLDVNEREDDDTSSTVITTEDKLNAALVSMLSTANSLLISTMTARSDLARLQIMESALDEQLDKREEAILTEINNNEKMIKWMEEASKKLDRVLVETGSSSTKSSGAARNRGGPSEVSSRHWRAPSTVGQVSSLETVSSLGVFDAKSETSTDNKSAAKRLENVLRRASSSSTGINTVQNRADNVSTAPKSLEKSDLASRMGIPSSSALTPVPAPSSNLAPPLLPAVMSSTVTAPSPSFSETSEFRPRTPSIASESGPSSIVSSREDTSVSAIQVILTPQTPYDELPLLTTSPVGGEDLRHALNKRSVSSLRSPNPIKASRQSTGPNVSEAALNRLSWQQEDGNVSSKTASQMLGNKGALESLRKLNGGSSFGQTPAPSSPGWGGALASWVGMSTPTQ